MEASGIPTKIGTIWGASAGSPYLNTIPVPSQQAITNGRASFTDGYPPNCFLPYASGGAGPFGGDMNGIQQLVTQWLQWAQAGGPTPYDSVFSTAIGGYPNGAVIPSGTTPGLAWRSVVDNNPSDPDTGGSNWEVAGAGQGSITLPGYWIFPGTGNGNGIILQWGRNSMSGVISEAYSFPLTFPNALLVLLVNDADAATWNSTNYTFYGAAVDPENPGGFTVWGPNWNGSTFGNGAGKTFNWLAVGY